ncbi:MAG TPA: hypothetical protein VMT38_12305 [Terracidiphilus sp.]|nr:hypothetical protein [Terracidiphilus sp.]
MRASFSFVHRVSPFLVSIVLWLAPSSALHGQSTSTEIDYTGSLYGYYRMEFNEPDQNHLPPVRGFLDFRKADSSRLLLAMGDNFGPEFGAAIQLENLNTPEPSEGGCRLPQSIDPNTKETRPESLYKDDARIAPRANCDNVLNFLMHAGFRAVVPGSQDFMYTARWLRVSALMLSDAARDPQQSPAIDNHDHAVNLLGANLRISLKGQRCPLLFSQNPFGHDAFRCVGDANSLEPEPLDWLSRLDRLSRQSPDQSINPTVQAIQQLASETFAKSAGRESVLDELAKDEIKILASAWGTRMGTVESSGNDAAGKGTASSQELVGLASAGNLDQKALEKILEVLNQSDLVYSPQHPLDPADRADFNTYRASLVSILSNLSKLADPSLPANATRDVLQKALGDCAKGGSIGPCFVLTPDARIAAQHGLLRTVAMEERDTGYTVAHLADGSSVLVIGVTGQSTMKAVSETNIRLCPGSGKDPFSAFEGCGDRITSGTGTTVAVDPVPITEALVRGAELLAADQNQRPFDKIVVMAQMPHTEAEVLSERVSTLLRLDDFSGDHYHVDVVLSEAESGYGTAHLNLGYLPSARGTFSAPVVAPIPSYDPQTGDYPGRVSRLILANAADQSFSLSNDPDDIFTPDKVQGNNPTTIEMLSRLMAQLQNAPAPPPIVGSDQSRKAEFILLKDLEKAAHPNADVVLLQSRDVELDAMGPGYTDYSVCANETEHPDLCKVRVALDRIFWKGDYIEYVAVTGKSLKGMLQQSEQEMSQQSQLADTGLSEQWLISYGIVQSTLTNLTEINQNGEPLWIPVDPSCVGDSPTGTTYCVGGTPIADDAYYWLVTSDQLAQDKVVYGTLQSLPSKTHERTDVYITAPLSHYLLASLHLPSPGNAPGANIQVATIAPPSGTAEKAITSQNEIFQQMPLWQIEFAKVIASFNSRAPVGGNTYAQNFQAVSDPRASAPTSQDFDLELANRITGTFFHPDAGAKVLTPISIGEQTNFAYDRALIGNLSNRPITPSYSLNNLSTGAFLQVRLNARSKGSGVPRVWSLPRSLLVLTPLQYQVNIDTPYIFFPFSAGQVPSGELTVQLPRVSSWNERIGFREEFGSNRPKSFFLNGNYFEAGLEFSTQNGILSSITLQDGSAGTPKTCSVSALATLQTCFSSAKFVINGTTTVVGSPAVKTLYTPGYYWTLHFQNHLFGKTPGSSISLVTDSQGDYFFGRPDSAGLATQTKYAIPLNLALTIPAKGNLTFAPTYSGFYYKAQQSDLNLVVNSFSIAARWYFARDARVPLRRQLPLSGPASADQTHTGKGH